MNGRVSPRPSRSAHLVLHVLEQSTDKGSKVDDVGGLVLLENGHGLLQIPTRRKSRRKVSDAFGAGLLARRARRGAGDVVEYIPEVSVLAVEKHPLLILCTLPESRPNGLVLNDELNGSTHQACIMIVNDTEEPKTSGRQQQKKRREERER